MSLLIIHLPTNIYLSFIYSIIVTLNNKFIKIYLTIISSIIVYYIIIMLPVTKISNN